MCRGATTVVFPRWQEQGLLLDSQAAPRVVACDALTATTVVKYYGTAHLRARRLLHARPAFRKFRVQSRLVELKTIRSDTSELRMQQL
jgi:hypothetical protein